MAFTLENGSRLDNKNWMSLVLETFATEAGANQNKIILLVQDRVGWRHEVSPLGHRSEKVNLPSGIETEFLPPYSPQLQQIREIMVISRRGDRASVRD
ncbi:MAG: hypothetical protein ACRC2S_15545 [Waterburya sp.]